jgi:hypothetical protein
MRSGTSETAVTAAFSRPGMGMFDWMTSPNARTAMGLNAFRLEEAEGGLRPLGGRRRTGKGDANFVAAIQRVKEAQRADLLAADEFNA